MNPFLLHLQKMFCHSAGPNRFLRYEIDKSNVAGIFIFAPVGMEKRISLDFHEVGKIVSEAAQRPVEYFDGMKKVSSGPVYTGLAEIRPGFFVRVSRLREAERELKIVHAEALRTKETRNRVLSDGRGFRGIYY